MRICGWPLTGNRASFHHSVGYTAKRSVVLDFR